jgi:hypothetical protein
MTDKPIILSQLPKERQKLLLSQGVPGADFIHTSREKYDMRDLITRYELDLPGLPTKVVAAEKQIRNLAKILAGPIRSNYVLGICGYPSDLVAKHLAIHIASAACDAWDRKHKPGQGLPLWHRVYGGLNDTLRDRRVEDMPCMLIISNVNEASSNYKLEKARDLLEKYSQIPRIVVIGGTDPLSFFASKLYHPINVGICIKPANRISDVI